MSTVSGPSLPTVGTDDATVGTVSWGTSAGNITAEDGRGANASGKNAQTHYLNGSGFGFSIPAGASIDGILAEIRHHRGPSGHGVTDAVVSLLVGGAVAGNNKAKATLWTGAWEWVSYGGATDLWGLSLAPTDINDPGFGLALSVNLLTGKLPSLAVVDVMRLTVYYTV